jgi:hypothetical protein
MSVVQLLLILLWMVSYVSGTFITDFIVDDALCQWYGYY